MFHLSSSFSPVSFSTLSFHGTLAPAEQSARSGYWRLFFMQMQEEALKNPELKAEVEKLGVVADLPPLDAPERRKARAKRLEPLVPLETFPEVKFARKPIYSKPAPVDVELPSWLLELRVDTEQWFVLARRNAEQLKKTQDAANDADFALRLLLLAA